MDSIIARHIVMSRKDDDSVNPHLCKPLRNYEHLTREQGKRPDSKKGSTEPGGPAKAEHTLTPDDRT